MGKERQIASDPSRSRSPTPSSGPELAGQCSQPSDPRGAILERRPGTKRARTGFMGPFTVLASLIIALPVAPAKANLVMNGGFEDGSFNPSTNGTMTLAPGATELQAWRVVNGNVQWGSLGRAADGSRYINLSAGSNGKYGGVQQTIATVAGSTYRLSFSISGGEPFTRPGRVTVSAGATQQDFWSSVVGGIWFWGSREMEFVATGSTTTISFVATYGPWIGVDQVAVNGPPGDRISLESLTLRTAEVAGCRNVLATATLTAPAPAGGIAVALGDTLSAASTPASLKFPEGATSRTFTIKTTAVAERQAGEVSATLDSTTLTTPLAIRPIGVKSLRLAEHMVAGTQPVNGIVELECPAAPGPITVNLASGDEVAARPVASTVIVPQGLQAVPFDVATSLVPVRTRTTIEAFANVGGRFTRLTLLPAVSLSTKKLTFADQAVGTPSSALTATLANESTVAVEIDGIGVAGTHAAWFLVAENCHGWLAAGTSCTITVRFKPVSPGRKSAQIAIATPVTSAPLVVWASGTGI